MSKCACGCGKEVKPAIISRKKRFFSRECSYRNWIKKHPRIKDAVEGRR
jgi:hypothetical protein